jgi:CheY-like chemotaxis protein
MPQDSIRALVVDDNEINRTLLGTILGMQGLEVDFAVNGERAVAIARDIAFDLILMDLNMPVMDGLTATTLIRRAEEAAGPSRVKLYIVTASDAPSDRRQARLVGADGYITKPINVRHLMSLAGGVRVDVNSSRDRRGDGSGAVA